MANADKARLESDHIFSREERIRYIGSLIDAEFLEKGAKYEELPDRIHFYISEKDIYHCGKVIYPVEKELGSTGLPYDDSEGELSKRVRYLKREEGGVDIMCEVSEKIMEQGRKIGEERKAHSTALNLSRMGLTPEQIASAVGESLEQVKRWLAGANPAK